MVNIKNDPVFSPTRKAAKYAVANTLNINFNAHRYNMYESVTKLFGVNACQSSIKKEPTKQRKSFDKFGNQLEEVLTEFSTGMNDSTNGYVLSIVDERGMDETRRRTE